MSFKVNITEVGLRDGLQNVDLVVKCNSALAENLINQKKEELNGLESNYESNITFEFKDEITLHEPIIEVSNLNKKEDKYSNKNIKNLSKKKTLKKNL